MTPKTEARERLEAACVLRRDHWRVSVSVGDLRALLSEPEGEGPEGWREACLRILTDMRESGSWDAATLDRVIENIAPPSNPALLSTPKPEGEAGVGEDRPADDPCRQKGDCNWPRCRCDDAAKHEALSQSNRRLREVVEECQQRLTQALGIIVEFGNLNGFRNLSDEELGKAVIEMAKAVAATLDRTRAALTDPHPDSTQTEER